jgi:hypothetical protein
MDLCPQCMTEVASWEVPCDDCGFTRRNGGGERIEVAVLADGRTAHYPDTVMWQPDSRWRTTDGGVGSRIAEVYDLPDAACVGSTRNARRHVRSRDPLIYHYADGLGGDHWIAVDDGHPGGERWLVYGLRSNRTKALGPPG